MTHINQRRDTAANWVAVNPVLEEGEVGWEEETRKSKLGNGVDAWNDLEYTFDPDLYALINSPAFTGNPTAPTQSSGNSSTRLATTAHVHSVTDPIAAEVAQKADNDSPAFTGTPSAPTPGPAVDDESLANAEWVNDRIAAALASAIIVPPGTISLTARDTAPTGWLICDGSALDPDDYPDLFAAISNFYGGDGVSTFNIPNLQGRFPVGVDDAQTEFDARNKTGGSKTHFHKLSTAGWARISVNGANGNVELDAVSVPNWNSDRGADTSFESGTSGTLPQGARLDGQTDQTIGTAALPPYVALHYMIKT